VAFLETLLPRREPAYMAEGFDDEEADEVRQLIGAARRDASVAALTPRLAAALAPDSGEALEAIALSGHAKRPRVAGMMKLIAGRLAAEAARAKPGPAVANGMPVQLVNLQSRPDLNGTCGTLIAFVPETGRYKVRLDGEDQPLAVRATNMKLLGAPTGHTITIREIRLSAGAEFVVVITGDIMTMPGLPRVPAANSIKLDVNGQISGLF
jgi:hypothetical protein